MKTILHLLSTGGFGGAEQLAINLIEAFKSKYSSVYCSPKGPIDHLLTNRNIPNYRLEKLDNRNVRNAISSVKPNIIHAHDFRSSIFAAFAAPKGTRIISHIHSNFRDATEINLKTLIYFLVSFRFYKIVYISDEAKNNFFFSKSLKSKSEVVINCVDVLRIKAKSLEIQNQQECDILYVGRLSEEKNPIEFIKIAGDLKRKLGKISAIMVGAGPLEMQCKEEIKKDGLFEDVKMIGFSNNPYKYMAQSKVLIVPSVAEGFPLAPLEAMSLGIPVVGTPVGGLKEIVKDGVTGYICKSRTDFIGHLTEILINPEHRKQLSSNGASLIKKSYSFEEFLTKFEKKYENCV